MWHQNLPYVFHWAANCHSAGDLRTRLLITRDIKLDQLEGLWAYRIVNIFKIYNIILQFIIWNPYFVRPND